MPPALHRTTPLVDHGWEANEGLSRRPRSAAGRCATLRRRWSTSTPRWPPSAPRSSGYGASSGRREQSYEDLRTDLLAARDAAKAAEQTAGEVRGELTEVYAALDRALVGAPALAYMTAAGQERVSARSWAAPAASPAGYAAGLATRPALPGPASAEPHGEPGASALLGPDTSLRPGACPPPDVPGIGAGADVRWLGARGRATTAPPPRGSPRCSPRRPLKTRASGTPPPSPWRRRRRQPRRAGHVGGELIAILYAGDVLDPDALAVMDAAFDRGDDVDVAYSDHDVIDADGVYVDPVVQARLLARAAARPQLHRPSRSSPAATVADAVGGFRDGYDGAHDYDFVLRLTERARRTAHVPRIVSHLCRSPGGGRRRRRRQSAPTAGARASPITASASASTPPSSRPRNEGCYRVVRRVAPSRSSASSSRHAERAAGSGEQPAATSSTPCAASSSARRTASWSSSSSTTPRRPAPVLVGPRRAGRTSSTTLVPYDAPFNFSAKINLGVDQRVRGPAPAAQRRHRADRAGQRRGARRPPADARRGDGRRQAAVRRRHAAARRPRPLRRARPCLPRLARRFPRPVAAAAARRRAGVQRRHCGVRPRCAGPPFDEVGGLHHRVAAQLQRRRLLPQASSPPATASCGRRGPCGTTSRAAPGSVGCFPRSGRGSMPDGMSS